MPRDISSSSSEDEADSPATESAAKQKETAKKTARYQCPADFVTFCHEPCSSTLTDSLKSSKNELWLIKAPASFSPESFNGVKVPLSGLQTLKVPAAGGVKTASGQQLYSVLASAHGTSELNLLTSDKRSSDNMVLGPAFAGLLNVCESYGDSSTNQSPQVIPAAPAPSIPPGLKQRFHPFGSKTPTLSAEDEADAAAFRPSSSTLKRSIEGEEKEEEEEEEEGRKKKKKKKKDKRIKTELEEEVVKVKEEPAAEIQEEVTPVQEGDYSQEKRKKKKKKKDRERKEAEEEEVKAEEVTVKCEPMDTSYDDAAEGSARKKKKKKKKKSKPGDD